MPGANRKQTIKRKTEDWKFKVYTSYLHNNEVRFKLARLHTVLELGLIFRYLSFQAILVDLQELLPF